MNQKDRIRIEHMLSCVEYVADFSAVDMQDRTKRNAALHELQIIGEAASHVSSTIKEQYPDIPWKEMIGFRNRVVHEYFGVDIALVVGVLDELPSLAEQLNQILHA